MLRLRRSGTTNLGSRSGTTKGAIRTAIGDDEGCDSNGDRREGEVERLWALGSFSFWVWIVLSLSLAAFVRLLCFVTFWLSVFLSFARATKII